MTRDELAQLLLCYIGTAADIIEFFDSFKVCFCGGRYEVKLFMIIVFRIQK